MSQWSIPDGRQNKKIKLNILKSEYSSKFFRAWRPYLIISIAAIIAFAPLSLMTSAVKNDVLVLEFPINYFISQCIHNREIPYWFNTWGMGFPLQSNLTWGIFSTPQILFSTIFNYNIYALHIELMFFIMMSGWAMFHLLKTYVLKDQNIALLLSICYMLSGFVIGSTQWLLYITAAAFVPLVVSSLLKLLQQPSFNNAFQLAVVYTLMFTSVYAALNIITTYCLVLFLLIYFIRPKIEKDKLRKQLLYISVAGFFSILFCFPVLYFTLDVLQNIDRGNSITSNASFFNSNYLHPSALSSMIFPFSSVRMKFENTEGTMLNSYAGLFVLLLLPAAIYSAIKEKNKNAFTIFLFAIIMLFLSFGNKTPLRNALNSFPGFSYFRHSAIFRFYFLLGIVCFVAFAFRDKNFNALFNSQKSYITKIIFITASVLTAICLFFLIGNLKAFNTISFNSVAAFIKNINLSQTILINSCIQIGLLILFFLSLKTKQFKLTTFVFITDVVLNTLLCTPFFSVSSYSLKEVNNIFHSVKGFPVQNSNVKDVPTVYTDNKMNNWYNINIYHKEVSSNKSYRGPLTLKSFSHSTNDSIQFGKKLVYDHNNNASVIIKLQRPTHVQIEIESTEADQLTLMQNYFPGWKAYYNNKPVDFIEKEKPGLTIEVPQGKGLVDFKYERKEVWLSALLLHLITLSVLIYCGIGFIKKYFIRSSSPS